MLDHAETSGSRAMLCAAGPSPANCRLPTIASQVTPYSRGVASRLPRLAENTSAALSAVTPTTAAVIVLSTGKAVFPAPRRVASRIPIAAGTEGTARAMTAVAG